MGFYCNECKKPISRKVLKYSKKNFGRILCRDCQNIERGYSALDYTNTIPHMQGTRIKKLKEVRHLRPDDNKGDYPLWIKIPLIIFANLAILGITIDSINSFIEESIWFKVLTALEVIIFILVIYLEIKFIFRGIGKVVRGFSELGGNTEHVYPDKFEDIINTIKELPLGDRRMRDEREFETAVLQYLRAKFPSYDIIDQYSTHIFNGRIDIVIDNEIALELKVADNKGNLDNLFAKEHWYKQEFEQLAFIILDVGRLVDLEKYVTEFEDKGVRVVIIEGKLSQTRQSYWKKR